jgi:hypothetical protein
MHVPDFQQGGARPDVATTPGDPASVMVVGPLRHAEFPPLCARCGAEPAGTLPVTRLFWRAPHESPGYYLTGGVEVPFCAPCIQAHRAETRPVPAEVRRRLLRAWLVKALPYLLPLGVNLWLVSVLAPNLLRALRPGGDRLEVLVWGAATAFFALLALAFFRMIRTAGSALIADPADRSAGSYVQVERGPLGCRFIVPGEPSSVLRAVTFTDDRSELFDAERHMFTFENREVADQFAELNAERRWDPRSGGARAARALRWTLMAGIVLGGLYLMVRDWLP